MARDMIRGCSDALAGSGQNSLPDAESIRGTCRCRHAGLCARWLGVNLSNWQRWERGRRAAPHNRCWLAPRPASAFSPNDQSPAQWRGFGKPSHFRGDLMVRHRCYSYYRGLPSIPRSQLKAWRVGFAFLRVLPSLSQSAPQRTATPARPQAHGSCNGIEFARVGPVERIGRSTA